MEYSKYIKRMIAGTEDIQDVLTEFRIDFQLFEDDENFQVVQENRIQEVFQNAPKTINECNLQLQSIEAIERHLDIVSGANNDHKKDNDNHFSFRRLKEERVKKESREKPSKKEVKTG